MTHDTFSMIVVGIDGRSGGDDAAALAHQLAGPGTTIALVHVIADDVSHEHGRRTLHAARVRFEGPCLTLMRTADDIGDGLHAAATDLSADLLIIGSPAPRPAGAAPPDLPGVVHGASCAVAVAPRGEAARHRHLRRIGVAYRDTPSGRAALGLAREIAATHRGEVHAITVVPVLPSVWLGPTLGGAEGASLLGGEAAAVAREHLDRVPDIKGTVAEGDPAAHLTRFSRTVDLLIVGMRGHGALRRLLVGSTAEVLLTASACPVLVIPGGAVGARSQEPGSQPEPVGLAPD